ncbi:MAG: DUF58 domain-containing protein [Rhodobacteraceae bacterium]|nr:DUF58 domain-containing protein [Paracoccaceae bacterium]
MSAVSPSNSVSDRAIDLKQRAYAAVDGLERSLAEARQTDACMRTGTHGRRRSGTGEEFWQFRPAADGDPARLIDWRRSAKSDGHFVRDREMQTSNSVIFWADGSRSMQFSGNAGRPPKNDRSRLIALAAAILFARTEERVGVLGSPGRPAAGLRQIDQMAHELFGGDGAECGLPGAAGLPKGARLVLLSDFLAPIEDIRASIENFAGSGATGALVQILDPVELNFPYDGRTLFRSVAGTVRFESFKAGGLRLAYQSRLRERMEAVAGIAEEFGWRKSLHMTNSNVRTALNWLCGLSGSDR